MTRSIYAYANKDGEIVWSFEELTGLHYVSVFELRRLYEWYKQRDERDQFSAILAGAKRLRRRKTPSNGNARQL
jgi:hypothetical protein